MSTWLPEFERRPPPAAGAVLREARPAVPASAGERYRVSVLESLSGVPATEWDAVGDSAIERSHAYLTAIASAGVPGCTYFYVLVRDAGGALVAHACAYRVRTDFAQLLPAGIAAWIGRLRRWWPSLLTASSVECSAPLVASHGISIADGVCRETMLRLIEQALAERARALRARLLVIHAFRRAECAGVECLRALGYRQVRNLPLARVRLRWPDYAGYLDAMRARYRTDLRRRLKRAAASGQAVRRLGEFGSLAEQCAEQLRRVQAQAAGFKRECPGAGYYRALDAGLGPSSMLLVVERDGRMVAHGMVLLGEREIVATYFGRDAGPAHNEWFQLMHEVIELACERGVGSINLGRGSYSAKTLLGAEVEPLFCYARSTWLPVNWLMRLAPGIADRQVPARHAIFRD